MAKGQVTFEFNDEQIAEIQRRVCDGVEHILGSLQKENQELKDENKKLIEMCISISSWIHTLANYSGDARNRLTDNVWFEEVKQKHFDRIVNGGNK